MHSRDTVTEYSLISKLLHWTSAIILFVQIPLGFYLVDLDFGPERLNIENIHVLFGLSIFYLVIIRLINNLKKYEYHKKNQLLQNFQLFESL